MLRVLLVDLLGFQEEPVGFQSEFQGCSVEFEAVDCVDSEEGMTVYLLMGEGELLL